MKWHNRDIIRFRNSHNCSINDPMLNEEHRLIIKLINYCTQAVNRLLHGKPDQTIRITERSIELPLALDFIQHAIPDEPFVELGCVLPYYFFKSKRHTVYDLSDNHYDNIKKDIRDLSDTELSGNIISISTIEHISLCEYGIKQSQTTATDVIEKIVSHAKKYFITFPLGYNDLLDEYARQNSSALAFLTRNANDMNDWTEVKYTQLSSEQKKFGTYCYANTVCILTNYTN